MTSAQLDIILMMMLVSIFVVFMSILTYIIFKNLILYKIEKKDIENSQYLLNNGWTVVTTNHKGIPLFFQNKSSVISLKDVKSVKAKNNAKI